MSRNIFRMTRYQTMNPIVYFHMGCLTIPNLWPLKCTFREKTPPLSAAGWMFHTLFTNRGHWSGREKSGAVHEVKDFAWRSGLNRGHAREQLNSLIPHQSCTGSE